MAKKQFSDVDLIAALNATGGNNTKAAEILGVTPTAVLKRRNLLPDGVFIENIEEFRNSRADIFARIQQTLLQYITPEKLKGASLAQLGTLFGIFYDKERIEKNLATEHIAHVVQERIHPEDMQKIKVLIKDMTERKRNALQYDDPTD